MEQKVMKPTPAPTVALPTTMTVSALTNSSTSSLHHYHQSRIPAASQTDWDINDATVPAVSQFDSFQDWADGHCRFVYSPDCEQAKRHTSGWAMRNTNNHNVHILKKSCLGVLVCSLNCILPCGTDLRLRPAICDKARKKQLGKACPNPRCSGFLQILACKGHCGYPVTHFWRHTQGGIFFQAKGVHDHPQPETKKSVDVRKKILSTQPGLPKKIRIPKKAVMENATKSGYKVKRKRKQGNDKRPCSTSCSTDPHSNFPLSKPCYRCNQSICTCSLETGMSKISAGGTSSSHWSSFSQGSATAAAVAAAAAGSWTVTPPSITITPPPLTHHHQHHHHLPTYLHHHHHHSQTGGTSGSNSSGGGGSLLNQQPLSTGRVLEFPQYPDSSSTFSSKLPSASGGCSSAYPTASSSSEGFFKPSDIFHLDYYDHTSQSSSSNNNNNVTSRHHPHHPSSYGCTSSGPPYPDYTGGSGDSLIADATSLHGPPWSIQSMPYANSFIGASNNNTATGSSGSSTGNTSITNNSSSSNSNNNPVGISPSTPSAWMWTPKAEVNGGTYLSSISAEYSSPEFYPSECFNYYIDNNNYCWAQQQPISNQGSSNIYP